MDSCLQRAMWSSRSAACTASPDAFGFAQQFDAARNLAATTLGENLEACFGIEFGQQLDHLVDQAVITADFSILRNSRSWGEYAA